MTTDWERRKQEALARKKAREEGGLDMMDAILDAQAAVEKAEREGRVYIGRDKIPEVLLEYCDWFHAKTGLEPDSACRSDWIDTFWYWNSKDLRVSSLDGAFSTYIGIVTRPGTLTKYAVAIQAKRRAQTHQVEIFRASDQDDKQYTPMPDWARKRLAKLKQDRIGTSAHEPKRIGDVMKGMQDG